MDSILTTPASGDWRMIAFNPGSHGTILNTTISYGGAAPFNPFMGGPDWYPAIRNTGGTLTFDHSTLINNGKYGINQSGGTTTMTNSEVAHTEMYGIVNNSGIFSINNSSIHDNGLYGLYNSAINTVDATGNWWGSATGPTHPSNIGGIGDKVTDNVNFANWTGSDPTQGCVINCNSNVLFLPGIEASRLYAMDDPSCTTINCENQLWEPNRNDDVRKLFLDANGKSTTAYDIYTRDTIDEVNITRFTPIPDSNIYKSFLADLEQWKDADHIIADYSAVPYDWRLSLDDILNNGYQD
jgi:hypothetical protein